MIGQAQTPPRDRQPETPSTAEAGGQNEGTAGPAAREIGGRQGPDPTRYGDWEKKGRCIDF
ncbi:MAG TPA: DUF1674 domain-containing protein [Xanthomonadaceae bacterium]|nr:DUF1674 domain-containing protein [Xanthomonadaceae bacterium]